MLCIVVCVIPIHAPPPQDKKSPYIFTIEINTENPMSFFNNQTSDCGYRTQTLLYGNKG